jgi:cobyrinic acid a,c-diamide synthase
MDELQSNKTLRTRIKAAIEAGLPVYAECGGLMYLSRSITWHQDCHEMVGAIPADAVMNHIPQGRGHTQLVPTQNHPWRGIADDLKGTIPAHEFHYCRLENIDPNLTYAYDVKRGYGIDGKRDGIVMHNMVANFSHLRDTSRCAWAKAFTGFVRKLKTERGKAPSPAQVAG